MIDPIGSLRALSGLLWSKKQSIFAAIEDSFVLTVDIAAQLATSGADSPASLLLSVLCCELGCCDSGPGVPVEPAGDLTSSWTPWPPYELSDWEGGRYQSNDKSKTFNCYILILLACIALYTCICISLFDYTWRMNATIEYTWIPASLSLFLIVR